MYSSTLLGFGHWAKDSGVALKRALDYVLKHPWWAGISGAATVASLIFACVQLGEQTSPSVAQSQVAREATEPFSDPVSEPVDVPTGNGADGITQGRSLPALNKPQPFAIVDPKPDSVVATSNIVVRGVGAVPGSVIRISVYSDRWYEQDCKLRIVGDAWSCGPVWLLGKAPYDVQIILAELIVDDKVIAEAEVGGVSGQIEGS